MNATPQSQDSAYISQCRNTLGILVSKSTDSTLSFCEANAAKLLAYRKQGMDTSEALISTCQELIINWTALFTRDNQDELLKHLFIAMDVGLTFIERSPKGKFAQSFKAAFITAACLTLKVTHPIAYEISAQLKKLNQRWK